MRPAPAHDDGEPALTTPHPECRDALRAELRAESDRYALQAETLYNAGQRGYARRSRVRSAALAWAAAALRKGAGRPQAVAQGDPQAVHAVVHRDGCGADNSTGPLAP